jgi:predicted dehydrogenase
MGSNRCRVALFGAGVRGTMLANHLITHPEVSVEAVADTNPQRARALVDKLGGSAYVDYRRVLADKSFDLVVVATMPVTHREICVAALESGANVLCEKPFAMNAAEARQMIDASRRASRFLSIGCNMRYMGSAQYLKSLIGTRRIGTVTYTHARALQSGIPFFGPHYCQGSRRAPGGRTTWFQVHGHEKSWCTVRCRPGG